MAKPRASQPEAPKRRSRVEIASLLIAAASLTSAIVFNALEVRTSTEQSRLARQATELQLVTTQGLALLRARDLGTNSVRALDLIGAHRRVSRHDPLASAVHSELNAAEFYAYLNRYGFTNLPGTAPQLKGALVCSYQRAQALLPADDARFIVANDDLPYLSAYVRAHPGRYTCLSD